MIDPIGVLRDFIYNTKCEKCGKVIPRKPCSCDFVNCPDCQYPVYLGQDIQVNIDDYVGPQPYYLLENEQGHPCAFDYCGNPRRFSHRGDAEAYARDILLSQGKIYVIGIVPAGGRFVFSDSPVSDKDEIYIRYLIGI